MFSLSQAKPTQASCTQEAPSGAHADAFEVAFTGLNGWDFNASHAKAEMQECLGADYQLDERMIC